MCEVMNISMNTLLFIFLKNKYIDKKNMYQHLNVDINFLFENLKI